jgi:putative ABC transport system permease protein
MAFVEINSIKKHFGYGENKIEVFKGLGVLIFLLIMYILTKQIIEKNSKSVSMTKIFGFSDIEIGKLYIVITSIVVVLLLALSIPIICLYLFVKIIIKY